jgi:UDP-N-acetylmuramate--alanine ligase
MTLANAKHIYFLGIGGIGMSAIARYFSLSGKQVSGYDRSSSVVTRALEAEGVEVFHEIDENHVKTADYMVYTPAIKSDNLEYQAAVSLGMPIRKRSQVLGEISETYKTLAVAGTHGKTTTSILLTQLLRASGVDCTAFLGGISRNLKSNFAFGSTDYMVTEADEYDRSFLTLKPWASIITSLDPDHLDIYGTPEEMKATYLQFASQVTGPLLVYASLLGEDWPKKPLSYGIDEGDYRAENLRYEGLATCFDYQSPRHRIEDIRLPLAGRHNVLNAVAAMGLSELAGANHDQFKAALADFKGIYRRLEVQYHSETLSYIDDYAHHPSELEAAISAARALFPERKMVVVFQPHLYSRTQDFHQGFAQSLSGVDEVIMMPIYPAREKPIPGVTSEMVLNLVEADSKRMASKENLIEVISEALGSETILLTLGAGDIDRQVSKINQWIDSTIKQGTRN